RRKTLFTCLSAKARAQSIFALESYDKKEPRTKELNQLLKKMPFKKDVLIVLPEHHGVLERSARNLPYAKTLLVNYLNPDDLLKYEHVLFLKSALPLINRGKPKPAM
ncbi:MAG: 50S ribosomal protein L4, partial [Candidatus Peregrinibacteria bacterium GW2011_GWA2_47_7]